MEGRSGKWERLSEHEHPMMILYNLDLGDESQGGIGPNSESEAAAAKDVAKTEYAAEVTNEFHCMDDRYPGSGGQLPGGILITELASTLMDPEADILPMVDMVQQKTDSLIEMGFPVFLHGDDSKGKEGCAANFLQRPTLTTYFESEHLRQIVLQQTWKRMEILELRKLDPQLQIGDVRRAQAIGYSRGIDERLWSDFTPEKLVQIALASGAEYEEFVGAHNAVGARTDISDGGFHSGAFRANHRTDDGEPLGALSITLGAYKNQLLKHGLEKSAVAKKLMHTILFSVGLLKQITKDGLQDIVVA